MRRINYVAAAERDVDEAIEYLTRESPTSVTLLIERLSLLEARLIETPLMYPRMWGPIRGAWLHPFRYIVHYRLLNEDVVVLGCFHTSRDPRVVRRILRSR